MKNSGKPSSFDLVPTILFFAFLLSIVGLLNPLPVAGQRKAVTKKKAVKTKRVPVGVRKEFIERIPDVCIPPYRDLNSLLRLEKGLALTLTVKSATDTKTLFTSKPLESLDEVLSRVDPNSVLTVMIDPTLKFDLVADVLRKVRHKLNACVNVQASTNGEDPYLYLSAEPKGVDEAEVKPNPLTLVARLDEKGSLALNNEVQGTIADPQKLVDLLRRVFKERADNGVFRVGTNEVERSIILWPVKSSTFAEVIRLADALKESGASPIKLQIDDSVPEMLIDTVPGIPEVPVNRRRRH